MAYTYSKIATVTVGSGGVSSIDFLAIPQNYTDLVLKLSARNGFSDNYDWVYIKFNNNTSNYSYKLLQGVAAATSYSGTTQYSGDINGATATASTFGSYEMYIPNYTSNNYKSYSVDAVTENNVSDGINTDLVAGLWSNTSPITSINLTPRNSTFNQYTTATLYGIKAEV